MNTTPPTTTRATPDPGLVADITAAALGVPGVTDAVAVTRHGARHLPARVHPTLELSTTPPGEGIAAPVTASSEVDGGELVVPAGAPMTLQDALDRAVELSPDKGTVFIARDGSRTVQTFPQLLAQAERVLGGLRAEGLRPGDAALFVFDDNRAYITAFWACVLGGFVPTPVAVAPTYRESNATTRRLRNAWTLLGHPVVLTDADTAPALGGVRDLWDEPDVRIVTVEELDRHAPDPHWFPTHPTSPVLNLLTSGSTGVPKCVQHTNASVAARTWSVAQARGYDADDVTVNWMPLDHVAIVMYNVRDVFLRCLHVNARTDHFLADPLAWLEWMSEYRATNTWAPNFAFAMVNEHADEIGNRSWDLSNLRAICNAAEPVIAATSRRFLELLAPHGLPPDAMWPGWGMSETCSVVTYECQHRDRPDAATVAVAQSSLGSDIRHVDPDDPDAVLFSSVGPPTPGVSMRIVDPDGRTLPRERMGELLVRGSTMMRGYHANPEANKGSYDAEGWFRTGDLAFVTGGSVVIAGRKKDQIVVHGVNYIAHEIESVIEQVDGVRVSFAAATGVREPGEGSDRLALFFVPASWNEGQLADVVGRVRGAVSREVGLVPDLVVPVTQAEFPKTGSGKIQRSALVTALREGRFDDRLHDGVEEAGWVVARRWVSLTEPVEPPAIARGTIVVLTDGDVPVDRLDEVGRVVTVSREDAIPARGDLQVMQADVDGIIAALRAAAVRHGPIATVVLGWTLPGGRAESAVADEYEENTSIVVAALRATARVAPDASMLVLTSGAVHASDGDEVDLGACALPGLVRTAVAEAAVATVRLVDLPVDRAGWGEALAVEVADPGLSGVVAVRDGQRRVPRLRPLEENDGDEVSPLVPNGLYVLSGGLGGLAQEVAGYLLAAYGARLLLLGRSPAAGERAARLADLEALGEVEYRAVDIADGDAVAAAVRAAEERWGRTTDVILHLAGADPTPQWAEIERHTLLVETPSTFERFARAKVAGTLALGRLLEERPATRAVLFGSVNGEFGGHSFGAYSTANTFLTGFADHWRHSRGRDVRCLAWSMWTEVGMNAGQAPAVVEQRGFRAIRPEEGLEALVTALSSREHYLLLGLDTANPLVIAELDAAVLDAQELVVAYTASGVDAEVVERAVTGAGRTCPVPVRLVELERLPLDARGTVDAAQLLKDTAPTRSAGEVVAPADRLEEQVAAVWSEVLNRACVGRDQSFFDLGGSSLRASRLLSAIGDRLAVRVRTQELYENPTVAELAVVLERRGLSRTG